MKKSLLVIFVLFSIKSSAQTYVPFSDSVANWGVYHWFYMWYDYNSGYELRGDTTILGVDYNKFYCQNNPDCIGAIREDVNKEIWYRQFSVADCEPSIFIQDTADIMLYSFDNYLPGDTIWLTNNVQCPYALLDSISTISINSVNRLVYNVTYVNNCYSSIYYCNDRWISGIGSSISPLIAFHSIFEWESIVTCFHDDSVYWLQDGLNSCEHPLGTLEKHFIDVSVSPNPVMDELKINTLEIVESYSVYSLSGKLLISSDTSGNRIPMKEFKRGIYIVEVATQKGVFRKKIMKE